MVNDDCQFVECSKHPWESHAMLMAHTTGAVILLNQDRSSRIKNRNTGDTGKISHERNQTFKKKTAMSFLQKTFPF